MELEICSVCLNPVTDSVTDSIITTKCCYNKFHKNCFAECMKIKLECPLCRGNQTDHVILINVEPINNFKFKNIIYFMISFILFIIASKKMFSICSKN